MNIWRCCLSVKRALVTGITGQDGSYLAELLLTKGYEVYGIQRRTSTITTDRIDHIMEPGGPVKTFYADLEDANSLLNVLMKVKPDELYNLASMSHVRISFDLPVYTGMVTGLGVARWLEALRTLGAKDTRFYQASSSEMFGASPPPQSEDTPFKPQSPYGCAKLYGYWMTRCYRLGYDMWAANGILFNHESPRRSENFVTKKIVRAAVRIKLGKQGQVCLGNLDAMRDWGFAGDYCFAIHAILTAPDPDDWVVSTGEYHSVREFAEKVFASLGMKFEDCCDIDSRFFRPNEVPALLGDSRKIRERLGWKPKVDFDGLVDMMVKAVWEEETNPKVRAFTNV